MKSLNQLLLNFKHKQNFNYNDYYVSKSNYYAFQLIENWPKWEKNILNIYGEKFSGKTHLSNIFLNKNKGIKVDENNISNETFKKFKLHENIIIDNYNNKSDEKLMYSIFNLVDQDNKYLIINSILPIYEIDFKLDDLKSRSKNCLFAKIEQPDDELMFAIILKSFSDRQIQIDKKLIDYIIKRIDRSYGKIIDFIYKVDELSLKKKKAIDLKIIKEIL
ncbi:DnaA/Hda family protein [Candidatus Pelagibacter sp.]|nr:DnaA/Hda family protein [Candidatus Pelagibacter sp.]